DVRDLEGRPGPDARSVPAHLIGAARLRADGAGAHPARRPCSRVIKRVIKRPAGPDPARAPVRASAPLRALPAAAPSDIRCARPTATASRRPRRAARTRAPRMALSSAGTGARIEDPPL